MAANEIGELVRFVLLEQTGPSGFSPSSLVLKGGQTAV